MCVCGCVIVCCGCVCVKACRLPSALLFFSSARLLFCATKVPALSCCAASFSVKPNYKTSNMNTNSSTSTTQHIFIHDHQQHICRPDPRLCRAPSSSRKLFLCHGSVRHVCLCLSIAFSVYLIPSSSLYLHIITMLCRIQCPSLFSLFFFFFFFLLFSLSLSLSLSLCVCLCMK